MKLLAFSRFLVGTFLISAFLILAMPVYAANGSTASVQTNLKNIAPDQAEAVLAKLSDEQVRSLLLTELSKDVPSRLPMKYSQGGLFAFIARWLHSMDIDPDQELESRVQKIQNHVVSVPGDVAEIFRKFGDGSGLASALKNFCGVVLIFLAALLVELLFKVFTASFRQQFLNHSVPDLNICMRLWAGIMHEIPSVVHLAVYGGVSLLFFILSPMSDLQSNRLLFMAILFSILFIRIGALGSQLFCSPRLESLRLVPLQDKTAEIVHKIILFFVSYVGIGMSFLVLISELGIPREAFVLFVMGAGTILLLLVAMMVVRNRQTVADYILSGETVDAGSNWVMGQFASLWHVPALLYLSMIWVIFMFQQTMQIHQQKSAFLLSLLVVPLFFLFDSIGQWVVRMAVSTLRIYTVEETDETIHGKDHTEFTPEQKERLLAVRVGRIVRVAVLLALGGWVMSLWGYNVPYAINITHIVFRSLVTLVLALIFWRVVSNYLERKITEGEPEQEEQEEHDDEWGAAAKRGRGYTLFPMVRKFLGSVLIVMVTLIILSTMGIEIGPLLAGAGVVGLAIGFGAKKLVSDVFSGFFFLLDDAFRVGEYLEAGSVSGAVEAITLRNVMLRHHRGMLMIVPYSDLGPITNYMRGGIVVKFNLEFPYDTDVDQVRRIIKKVGEAMLEDEEFGKDFIKPVKSQGVREIANSVMVIRVKFTAQPGKHFVIRREAYRRLTEALAAKGIHYAHRKVIVEVPGANSDTDNQKIAEAGAAAGLAAMVDDEKKAKEGGGS